MKPVMIRKWVINTSPLIEKLTSVGLYIDSEIIAQVLKAIGEHPVH